MKCHQLLLLSSFICFWLATSPAQAQTQISPDATLPSPSLVTQNGNTNFVITGGAQAGSNLFHSFSEFSVPERGVASFQGVDSRIGNVISRVTGASASNINGRIEVLQPNGTVSSTNFFLLNPNGIIFGPNASLNIGGSFLASTASSLNFADSNSFSAATNGQTTAPLLTVSAPIGLQFGSSATSIQVQGARLQLASGKTLGLVGGSLELAGGVLITAGGRIELGSVAATLGLEPVQINLTAIDKGWALGYESQNFQDIQLSQRATLDVRANGGGDIQVQGRRVTLAGGSQMLADTQGSGAGGTLAVNASDSVEISGSSTDGRYASGLFARVSNLGATGSGGNLTIATRHLSVLNGAEVTTSTSGSGKAGNLTVQATDSVLVSGSTDDLQYSSTLRATVQEGAIGEGGNLTIDTAQLTVQDGGQVLTSTFGAGKAGNLTVQNARDVELIGGVFLNGEFFPSGLFTQTSAEAATAGDGGDLSISAQRLTLRDGAQVNSTTLGAGKAGNLTIRVTDVEIVGDALSTDGEVLTTSEGLPFPSGLFAGTDIGSSGDGGTLSVETEQLRLRDGAVVQTSTLGAGNAGNLEIQASESVELLGTAKGRQNPTSLLAVSGGFPGTALEGITEAEGKGGDLSITTGKLSVRDGAQVAVSSLNPNSDEGAGNLQLQAQTVHLDNSATLTAATASGDGGIITLQVQDLLLLRRNSEISTTAGIAGAGGNGGNINLNAGFVVTLPQENSDIIANAFNGNGGNIELRAESIFGLQYRNELTPRLNTTSDITASSRFGVSGTVTINTPDVDPSRGLVSLPTNVVDASGLIARSCRGGGERIARQQSEFVVTGRGGLPPSPSQALSTQAVWQDLRPPARQVAAVNSQLDEQLSFPIVEAQGWVMNSDGQVILTAQAPSVTPYSSEPQLVSGNCH